MVKCSAKKCNNASYKKTPGLSFHRFPKDDELKKLWLQNLNLPDWQPSSSSVLCSDHFEPHFKDSSIFCTVLRRRAVPTLFEVHSKALSPVKQLGVKTNQAIYYCGTYYMKLSGFVNFSPIYMKLLQGYISRKRYYIPQLKLYSTEHLWDAREDTMRNKWLKLAKRDPQSISRNTRIYLCEDHFNGSSSKSQPQKNTPQIPDAVHDNTSKDTDDTVSIKLETDDVDDFSVETENAPYIEQATATSVGQSGSKRARLDLSQFSSDYIAEIYEFGKFVAEQLLCLDVKEARELQEQIKQLVLSCNTALPKDPLIKEETGEDPLAQLKIVSVESIMQVEPGERSVGSSADTSRVQDAGYASPVTIPKTKSLPISSVVPKAGSRVIPVKLAAKSIVNPVTQSIIKENTACSSAPAPGPSRLYLVKANPSVAKTGSQGNILRAALKSESLTDSGQSNVQRSASSKVPSGYLVVSSGLLLGTESRTSARRKTVPLESLRVSSGPSNKTLMTEQNNLKTSTQQESMVVDETLLVTEEPESESMYTHTNVFPPSITQSEYLGIEFDPES